MEKKEASFSFALNEIVTKQFAIIKDAYKKGEASTDLAANLLFGCDPETRRVAVDFTFRFEQQGKQFLVIEVSTAYLIAPESWERMLDDDKVTIPRGLATHLAILSIGNVRGVLHAKTENTEFNWLMIPLYYVADDVKFDLVIDRPKDG